MLTKTEAAALLFSAAVAAGALITAGASKAHGQELSEVAAQAYCKYWGDLTHRIAQVRDRGGDLGEVEQALLEGMSSEDNVGRALWIAKAVYSYPTYTAYDEGAITYTACQFGQWWRR